MKSAARPSSLPPRAALAWLLIVLLSIVIGCGRAAYDQKLDARIQQLRAQASSEEAAESDNADSDGNQADDSGDEADADAPADAPTDDGADANPSDEETEQ